MFRPFRHRLLGGQQTPLHRALPRAAPPRTCSLPFESMVTPDITDFRLLALFFGGSVGLTQLRPPHRDLTVLASGRMGVLTTYQMTCPGP